MVATIDVGTRPNWLAVTERAIWVENTGDGTVSRIDPATNAVVDTFPVGFETGVHGLAAADGSIWVLDLHGPRVLDNLHGTTVWRLDPGRLPG